MMFQQVAISRAGGQARSIKMAPISPELVLYLTPQLPLHPAERGRKSAIESPLQLGRRRGMRAGLAVRR
jgi:hypothetical protein